VLLCVHTDPFFEEGEYTPATVKTTAARTLFLLAPCLGREQEESLENGVLIASSNCAGDHFDRLERATLVATEARTQLEPGGLLAVGTRKEEVARCEDSNDVHVPVATAVSTT
jgi:hypothetical protein